MQGPNRRGAGNGNGDVPYGGDGQLGGGGGGGRRGSWVGDVAQAAAQRFSGSGDSGGGTGRRRSRNLN